MDLGKKDPQLDSNEFFDDEDGLPVSPESSSYSPMSPSWNPMDLDKQYPQLNSNESFIDEDGLHIIPGSPQWKPMYLDKDYPRCVSDKFLNEEDGLPWERKDLGKTPESDVSLLQEPLILSEIETMGSARTRDESNKRSKAPDFDPTNK